MPEMEVTWILLFEWVGGELNVTNLIYYTKITVYMHDLKSRSSSGSQCPCELSCHQPNFWKDQYDCSTPQWRTQRSHNAPSAPWADSRPWSRQTGRPGTGDAPSWKRKKTLMKRAWQALLESLMCAAIVCNKGIKKKCQ